LTDQMISFVDKLQALSDLLEGKKRSLDVITQGSELLQLPIEDVLSQEVYDAGLSFQPSFKLFKLQSKAVNLLGTVSDVIAEKQRQKVKGMLTVDS